jgi:hypothetical protein
MTTVAADQPEDIRPGDIYEDCAFHPVLCTHNDGEVVMGISLIDASSPRTCDLKHCGVIKLSINDVIAARTDWRSYLAHREEQFAAEQERELAETDPSRSEEADRNKIV